MHWYARDGSPCYEIKGANGKLRPTTLRDAKKLNLLPSVTEIIAMLDKPNLNIWKTNQVLDAALEFPGPRTVKTPEAIKQWKAIILDISKKVSVDAAKRGTELHNCLDQYFTTGELKHPEYLVKVVDEIHKRYGYNFISEQAFANHQGYGGKIDLHNTDLILDFKTKSHLDLTKDSSHYAYEEHAMQLAAYGYAIHHAIGPEAKYVNVFISTDPEQKGTFIIHEWSIEDILKYFRMFMALLEIWQIKYYDSSFSIFDEER